MEKNAGYVIRESVLFDNKRGFAIAEHGNPKVPAPFVTWQFLGKFLFFRSFRNFRRF